MKTVEEAQEILDIKETHIVKEDVPYGKIGWARTTISGFEVDDGDLHIQVSLPWDESDGFFNIDGNVDKVCDAYGHRSNEFQLLEGEDLWMLIDEISYEDGEISSDGVMSPKTAAEGPNTGDGGMSSMFLFWLILMSFFIICIVVSFL